MIRFVELDASTERSSYTEIAVGHEAVLQEPAFVLGSFPGAATKNYFGDYRIPPAGVYELHDCALSSDGLLTRDGAFFTSLQLLITEKIVNECVRDGELTATALIAPPPPSPAEPHDPWEAEPPLPSVPSTPSQSYWE